MSMVGARAYSYMSVVGAVGVRGNTSSEIEGQSDKSI